MATQKYETVIVYDPDLKDDEISAQIERVKAIVTEHNGVIVRQDVWGKRQLAYTVNRKNYGIYVVLVLEGDNGLVADLERQLKINESVLRSLTVVKDQFAPDLRPELLRDDSPMEGESGSEQSPDALS